MSTVTPPPPASPAPSPASSPGAASVPDPPPALTRAPRGAMAQAVVTARTDQRITLVMERLTVADSSRPTRAETFELRTPLPLDVGARVTFQVAGEGRPLAVRVAAVNGQPLTAAQTAQGHATLPTGMERGGAMQSGAVTVVSLSRADGFPATVVAGAGLSTGAPGAPGGTPLAPPSGFSWVWGQGAEPPPVLSTGAQDGTRPTPLPSGTTLVVRLAGLIPPSTTTFQPGGGWGSGPGGSFVMPPGPAQGAGTQGLGTQSAQGQAPVTPAPSPPAPPFAGGSEAASPPPGTARPSGPGTWPLPNMPAPPPAHGGGAHPTPVQGATGNPPSRGNGPAAPPVLTGVVTGNTLGGQPLVQTPAGLVALGMREGGNLPKGASVRLDVMELRVPPPPSPVGAAAPGALSAPAPLAQSPPGQGWPAFEAALQSLQRSDPVASQTLMNALPQADGRLAANLTMLMNAAATGNLRAWIAPDALKALERAVRGPQLARQVGEDVREMGSRARETQPGEWRAWVLPFHSGAEIEKIHLYLRRALDEEEDQPRPAREGGEAVRFLIDISLSRLGPMQLDGLANPSLKRFDLVVRTPKTLPREMRAEIHALFADTMAALGQTGEVFFQVTPNFVKPEDKHSATARPGWLV